MTPARMVRMYLAGATTREIAAEADCEATKVRQILAEAGVARRRLGPRGRTDVATALIIELRDDEGLSWSEVAAECGMSKTGVRMRYAVATSGRRPR